jgi:hypothetical protein
MENGRKTDVCVCVCVCCLYRKRVSKWDRGPDEKELTSRPAECTQTAVSTQSGVAVTAGVTHGGLLAATEAAAKVNAMLMAKGTLKPAEPLVVNEQLLKAKLAPVSISCSQKLYKKT